eukprot:CCRYP_015578-RA/>CCRYP_015578-RA protein AED:0.04 eAED:0.04 QI:324/1/0.5/1/0/0/2/0/209
MDLFEYDQPVKRGHITIFYLFPPALTVLILVILKLLVHKNIKRRSRRHDRIRCASRPSRAHNRINSRGTRRVDQSIPSFVPLLGSHFIFLGALTFLGQSEAVDAVLIVVIVVVKCIAFGMAVVIVLKNIESRLVDGDAIVSMVCIISTTRSRQCHGTTRGNRPSTILIPLHPHSSTSPPIHLIQRPPSSIPLLLLLLLHIIQLVLILGS